MGPAVRQPAHCTSAGGAFERVARQALLPSGVAAALCITLCLTSGFAGFLMSPVSLPLSVTES